MQVPDTIRGGNELSLEVCLDLPKTPGPYPGVVICHPHPLYGGNMKNNVVAAISRAVTARGIAVLRFNFRGVGRSEGSFDSGQGEQEDALTALSYLARHSEIISDRIGIAGYSFGGMIAMGAGAKGRPVKAIAAVSPVVDPGILDRCTVPKLIICGEEDDMIPAQDVLREAAGMAEPKKVEIIPGADHFWWGHEELLGDMVAGFFMDNLCNN